MVVQRTILPKAPNYFLVQPNGQNLKTVINVPNSIPILSNVSTAPPGKSNIIRHSKNVWNSFINEKLQLDFLFKK